MHTESFGKLNLTNTVILQVRDAIKHRTSEYYSLKLSSFLYAIPSFVSFFTSFLLFPATHAPRNQLREREDRRSKLKSSTANSVRRRRKTAYLRLRHRHLLRPCWSTWLDPEPPLQHEETKYRNLRPK